MGAADLLAHVRAAGFTLEVADGKLLVAPASMLTDELRTALRACKPEVLALLHADRAEAAREAFEERAGIRQYDGEMGQAQAEAAAAADLGMRVLCLSCMHRSRRRTCLEPVAAGITTSFSIVWCELLTGEACSVYVPTNTNIGEARQ